MPSFGDSAVIFVIALLLFGPKKLPELARQIGKLLAEFRRASNEFRIQMDEEFRIAEQAEQQKKIAATQTATPGTAASLPTAGQSYVPPDLSASEPTPIASEGDLSIMPPATGLPTPRESVIPADQESASALTPVLQSVPHESNADPAAHVVSEASIHG